MLHWEHETPVAMPRAAKRLRIITTYGRWQPLRTETSTCLYNRRCNSLIKGNSRLTMPASFSCPSYVACMAQVKRHQMAYLGHMQGSCWTASAVESRAPDVGKPPLILPPHSRDSAPKDSSVLYCPLLIQPRWPVLSMPTYVILGTCNGARHRNLLCLAAGFLHKSLRAGTSQDPAKCQREKKKKKAKKKKKQARFDAPLS